MDSRITSNTSKSTGGARKITIKRVTSLPKDKKNELYNPFAGMTGNPSPSNPQKEQEDTRIYDPFEPTWSEEEKNSPESDDWNPECPEKDTTDLKSEVKNSGDEIEVPIKEIMKISKNDPKKETTDVQINVKSSENETPELRVPTEENSEKGKDEIAEKSISAKIAIDVQSDIREKQHPKKLAVDNIWSPEDLKDSETSTEKLISTNQSPSPAFTPKENAASCEFDDIVDMYLDDQLENDTKQNIENTKKCRDAPPKDDDKSSISGASPEKDRSPIKTSSQKHDVDKDDISAVSLKGKKHHKRKDSKHKFSSDDNVEVSNGTEKDSQSRHEDKKRSSKHKSSGAKQSHSTNSDVDESRGTKQNSDKANADLEEGEIFDAKREKISNLDDDNLKNEDKESKNSGKEFEEAISDSRESASKSHKQKRKKSHADDDERDKSRHKKSKRRSREKVDSDRDERRDKKRKSSSFDDSAKKKDRDRRDSIRERSRSRSRHRDKRTKRDRSDRDKSESRGDKAERRSSRDRDRRKRSHDDSDEDRSESRGYKAKKRSNWDRRKRSHGDSDRDRSESRGYKAEKRSSRDRDRRKRSHGDSDRGKSESRSYKAEKEDKRRDDHDSHRDKYSKSSSSHDKSRNSSERGRSHRRKSRRECSIESETKTKSMKSKSSKDSSRQSRDSDGKSKQGSEVLHETSKANKIQQQQRMSFGSWDASDDDHFMDNEDESNEQSLLGTEKESFRHKRKETNQKSRSANRDTKADHTEAKHSNKAKHKHKRSKCSASPGSAGDQGKGEKKLKKRHKKKRHASVSSEDTNEVNFCSGDESHVINVSLLMEPTDDKSVNPTNVAADKISDDPVDDAAQIISVGDKIDKAETESSLPPPNSDQELSCERNAEIANQRSSPGALLPSKGVVEVQDGGQAESEKSPLKQDTSTNPPDISPPSELNEGSTAHQSIKESLSFAEEFVERSRMRWKEKKSSVASSNESPQLCVLSDSESKTNHRNFTDAEQESGQNAQTDWNGKTNSRIPGLDIAESPVNDTDFRTCAYGTPPKPPAVDLFEDSPSVDTPQSQSDKKEPSDDTKCSATKEASVEYSPSDMILDSENSDSVKMDDFDAAADSIPAENEADTKEVSDQVEDDATMQQTMLNPTQILNSIGLNPQQHSAAQNAILSIAELSKHLSLDKFSQHLDGKTNNTSHDTPVDGIESSAVELYNKDKKRGHMKKLKFREQVIEEAKSAIKPYYERRQITKTEYKDILKKAVNKIYNTEVTYEVNTVKIRRLIRRYIEKYQVKHSKKKDKSTAKDQASKSPPAPQYQPLTDGKSGAPCPLPFSKREPRKLYTLPDLQLPPPPPPPKR